MSEEEDYIEGVEKEILMGHCLGCSHAYPLEDMNEQGLCEECEEDEEEVCEEEYKWLERVESYFLADGSFNHDADFVRECAVNNKYGYRIEVIDGVETVVHESEY